MNSHEGRRVIIAGGATGIGAALVEILASQGAHVVVGDINEAGLARVTEKLAGRGLSVIPVACDLADAESIARLVEACVGEFGGIDALAIPAADLSPATLDADVEILEMDPEVWERTMRVNVIGHGLLMKAVLPHMIAQGGGTICVVSSGASYMGLPFLPAYAASKAALGALVRSVAKVYGPKSIRCNAVDPGHVVKDGRSDEGATAPLGRFGRPDDVARAIAILLAEDSGWITGQVIGVNGGGSFRE